MDSFRGLQSEARRNIESVLVTSCPLLKRLKRALRLETRKGTVECPVAGNNWTPTDSRQLSISIVGGWGNGVVGTREVRDTERWSRRQNAYQGFDSSFPTPSRVSWWSWGDKLYQALTSNGVSSLSNSPRLCGGEVLAEKASTKQKKPH